jgi:hypothetical protein
MTSATGREASIGQRLQHELRNYLVVSAYLFVCFAAILFYKAAILSEAGQSFAPLGLAAGKALILGKFLLLGEAAGVGTRVGARSVLQRIAIRALFFLALLVALTLVEEIVVGLVHGESLAGALAALGERPLPELLASILLMLLVLLPLAAVTEISRALGPGGLRRLLLSYPDR